MGGTPRSGSAMIASLVGRARGEQVRAVETWMIPFARHLWAGGAPNPACRAQLTRAAAAVLADAYGDDDAQLPDDTLGAMSDELVAIAVNAPSQAAALRETGALCERLRGQLIGSTLEATPANIFSHAYLSSASGADWVVVHREPFSVIASLRARPLADPFMPSGGDLETSIGVYLRYGGAVAAALRSARPPYVAPYDTLVGDPEGVIDALKSGADLSGVGQGTRRRADHDGRLAFSVDDRRKVALLTRTVREALGYGVQYYDGDANEGVDIVLPAHVQVSSLHGMHTPDEGMEHRWMSKQAAFVVYARADVRNVSATFVNHPNLQILEQRLVVRDGSRREIANVAIRSGENYDVLIPLNQLRPTLLGAGALMYVFEIEAEAAVLPVARFVGNLDQRVLSCFVSPWRAV